MTIEVPGAEDVTLFPCSRDAYSVIDDLNSLASGKGASFLALASLPRTFALELIESILTNHASLFRPATHPELLLCLRQSTCPLLIRSLSEPAVFPTTLRLMRLLFVLLRHFSAELRVEVEILMSILLRLLAPPASSETAEGQHPTPPWQRVLAMEVARSLCQDGALLRNFWRWYDGSDNSASVFTGLVDALHRLSIENAAIIGRADAAEQMSGPEAPGSRASVDKTQPARSGFYQAARGVLAGASETGAGLSQTSVPGVQLLDQLDKIEAPSPPPTYIYLLALQSLTHLSQSIASFVLPAYSSYINASPRLAGRAPPALDLDTYDGPQRDELLLLRSMIQQAWPLLLASFTFFLSAKCDDVLFSEVLVALRNFTNTTGVLSLTAPRDALIASLARFAVPRTVLNRLEEARRASREDDSSSANFVALSERNAACLKAITHISYYLSGSLAWRDILETLCEAEYVLRLTGSRRRKGAASSEGPEEGAYSPRASMASFASLSTIAAGFQSGSALDARTKKPAAMSGLDTETLLSDIARVFENTGALDQGALTGFLQALVALVADVTGASPADQPPRRRNSASAAAPLARFASTQRSFAITSLELVAMLNVARLAVAEPACGWNIVVSQLVDVFSDNVVRAVLRVQASEALDSFLLACMGVRDAELDAARLQKQVLHALAKQAVLQPHRAGSTDLEVRKLALEALLRILEAHGHELTTGWETIFHACSAACAGTTSEPEEGTAAAAGSVTSSRGSMPLIKAGFASLQLVCSDLLSSLTLAQLELCASTLTSFSKQTEDINVALTANGTLWTISAELSSRTDQGADALAPLWTHLLRSLQSVSADSRAEVRNGAISNLFRVLEQYGSTLDVRTWSTVVLPDIIFALLSALDEAARAAATQTPAAEQQDQLAATLGTPQSAAKQWNESRVLAWTNVGRIVAQYLGDKISVADSFEARWQELLQRAQRAFLESAAPVPQAAMLALHGIASVDAGGALQAAWDALWRVLTDVGQALPAADASLTQANLLAYVQTVQVVYARLADELESARLDAMLSCLKACVTYSRSADQPPDVDALTPVQAAVRGFLKSMRVPVELRSRLLTDLAEFSTLAFTVAPAEHAPGMQRRQPTYVALHRASAQDALERFEAFKGSVDVYTSGALDAVFVSLMLPIKLKYDCPAASRHAKEPPRPLWQSAALTFCKIARSCCLALQQHGDELPDEHVHALWRQIVAVFEAALGADK
jgi:hypothetical protein